MTSTLPPISLQVASKMAAMGVNDQAGHGTIKAPASIDAEADAGVLRKAMKGIGNTPCTLYIHVHIHVCVHVCT